MTVSDAAGLACLGLHDRPLVAAILRAIAGRSTAEDLEALEPRLPDESVLAWACRCRRRPRATSGHCDEWSHTRAAVDAQLARAARIGVQTIPFGDPTYPTRLAAIADPPPLLWLRGQLAALSGPAVAIVGSRAATPYALQMSRRLATDLAAAGVTIVSGLARGVDAAAHRAVVEADAVTVGVLGCGIDRIYPVEHGELATRMHVRGAVIGEFPPGVPPLPHHFPLRNRIISGLAHAVVVVEAPEKSGSLITASAAAEQGRDVMVVPGAAGPRNRGGHLLIRDGAKLVESADDILQELDIDRAIASNLPTLAALTDMAEFTVDEVSAQTGELPNVVLARLLELELSGQIQRIGGGRFIRVIG
jgi:DNA processing protein